MKYNPDEAYAKIQEMVYASRKEDRILAIKLLSGIATKRSVEMLIYLLHDSEIQIKRQAISALKTLLKENLDSKLVGEIENLLSQASEKEGWIIN